MVIGIDLDEVFFDFVGPFLEFANKKYGTNFTRADMTEYSFEKSGVIPKGTNKLMVQEFGRAGGLRHLPPRFSAEWMVHQLQMKNKLMFITSRDLEFQDDTKFSLVNAGILTPVVYFSDKTHPKSEFVLEHHVDIFIDDCPRFVRDVYLNTKAIVIMMSAIDNAIKEADGKYHTLVNNWIGAASYIARTIQELQKQKDPV